MEFLRESDLSKKLLLSEVIRTAKVANNGGILIYVSGFSMIA